MSAQRTVVITGASSESERPARDISMVVDSRYGRAFDGKKMVKSLRV